MNASNKRRVVLYGAAALALSGLVYGGFVYQSKPDVSTLLSCAQPQLALGLHAQAEPFVRDALEQDPECFEALIMLAAIHEKAARSAEAEALYRRLLPRAGAATMRSEILVAIARLELSRGEAASALATLEGARSSERDTRWKRAIVRARCLHALGRTDELEGVVSEAEENALERWSSNTLRQDLGLAPKPEAPAAIEGAESSAPVQGAKDEGR